MTVKIRVSKKFAAFVVFAAPKIAGHIEPNFDVQLGHWLDPEVGKKFIAWKQGAGINETSETRAIILLNYWKAQKGNSATVEKFLEAVEPKKHQLTGELFQLVQEWDNNHSEEDFTEEVMDSIESYLNNNAPSKPNKESTSDTKFKEICVICGTVVLVVFLLCCLGGFIAYLVYTYKIAALSATGVKATTTALAVV